MEASTNQHEETEKGETRRRESLMMRRSIKIYYSYAHADREWLERLSGHLEVFKQQGHITEWDNSAVQPGTEWSAVIDYQRSTSDLILLLLSAHYLASDFCSIVEMPSAIELHERGKARTIPILLSPVSWKQTPLGTFHALPSNGIPLTQWSKSEEALTSIAQEIGQIVDGMLT
jgi:TIR domain